MREVNFYKRQIIEYSFQNQLSHVSSCLNAVDPLRDIYRSKKPEDKVVLSCGHAYLALRVILEDLGLDVPKDFRTHPDRGGDVHCSTGSLGMGFPIALGMALAKPENMVYCVTTDGEWNEGSMYEALRLMVDLPVPNIQLWVIVNGYSAYGKVDTDDLEDRIRPFAEKSRVIGGNIIFHKPKEIPFLDGVHGHYRKITDLIYEALKEFYA
jgi:transketolase